MTTRSGPRMTIFIILAVLVGLGGIAGFVYALFDGLTGLTRDGLRVTAPGSIEINLPEAGAYSIFWEYRSSAQSGAEAPGDSPTALSMTLLTATGREIPLVRPNSRSTYDIGDRHGLAIREFEIANPGRHKYSTQWPENLPSREVTLFIVRGYTKRLLSVIVISGGIMMGGLIGCVALVIGGLVWTRKKAAEMD